MTEKLVMSKSEGQEKIDKISSKASNLMLFIIVGFLFGILLMIFDFIEDFHHLGIFFNIGGCIILISAVCIPFYISLYKKTQVLLSEQLKEDKEKVKDTLDKF